MIRLDRVGKTYPDGSVAVGELSLEIPRGEICVLVGPSGCGKTTTLQMINRLVEPTSGRIFLDGDDVTDADPVELRRHGIRDPAGRAVPPPDDRHERGNRPAPLGVEARPHGRPRRRAPRA